MSDLVRGNQLFREGKLEEALAIFQKVIKIYPEFSWSYFYLGEVLLKIGKLNDAIEAYSKALSLKPDSVLFQRVLENLLFETAQLHISTNIKHEKKNSAEKLARKIYGQLPADNFSNLLPVDQQSFLEDIDCFKILIETIKPQIIIEVGSWKGHSAILMAQTLDHLNLNYSRVLCVDTWLGSLEHWENEAWRNQLYLKYGHPSLYERFLSNIIKSGLKDYIIPFPMVSNVASTFFSKNEIKADLIYIDGSHDYESVKNDLEKFFPLLSKDGIIFGTVFSFPPTGNAVQDFARSKNLEVYSVGKKWIIFKNGQFNKFSHYKSLTPVIGYKEITTSLQEKQIKLLPITMDSPEVFITKDEEFLFSGETGGRIYIYKPNSDDNETNFLEKDNIIDKACFTTNESYKTTNFGYIYTPKPIYLGSFPWALVMPKHSLVISQFKGYWSDSSYLINWNKLPQIVISSDKEITLREKIEHQIVNDTTILLASNNIANNYYHWHINCLPVAYSLKEKINSGKFRVISCSLNDWQKRSLLLIGIELSAIEYINNETLLCRTLVYSSYMSNIAFHLPSSNKNVFNLIKNNLRKRVSINKSLPQLIFVSREDNSKNRRLLNEYELFVALEKFGFVKVIPGNLSYDQQVQTFSNARIIVGQHGAGLTNIGFAPPKCTVIEIFAENDLNTCYRRLTQVLGHKYVYILCKVNEKTKYVNRHQIEFAVSVDKVVSAVSHILEIETDI